MSGKVVVNRSMSLDGFIAGPGDAMDWIRHHPSLPRPQVVIGVVLRPRVRSATLKS